MKFCVLAKISKRTVSFWYQSGSDAYAPLIIKESNEIPLYFYVNGNDFLFGSAARDLFNRHDPYTFGNYFEIIKDPAKHFTIYGNKKPVKQLLYYGVEQYLSHFLNTILYKTDSIESYRQHFPLRFLFDQDIEDNEKSLVENLFQEAGYFNLNRMQYSKSFFEVLSQKQVLLPNKSILLLSGIDNVLYLSLYRDKNAAAIGSLKLQGQGADPRVRILADMIVEYITLQNSYLSIDKDREIALLLPFCSGLLQGTSAIINGDAELSDGNKYWFKVNTNNLHERLLYYSNDNMVYAAIDDLLKLNNLKVEEVMLLLGTAEVSTAYFLNKLLKRYQYVKAVQPTDISDTMKALFTEIATADYTVQLKPREPVIPSVLPVTPPVSQTKPISRPVLPMPKLPPPMPPKKEATAPKIPGGIPKLPEIKNTPDTKTNPVKLPPLPPKKG
ncbi:hypothetical protein [Pedobacter sp. N23S346]|uniref:hypothetical protein n=1 Tax=Pedobacter sp. N23S346 TaxID=3402750 RepID=UPI003AC2FFA8